MHSDELGHRIRVWRDRLDPAAAPGLRREELASLAGLAELTLVGVPG